MANTLTETTNTEATIEKENSGFAPAVKAVSKDLQSDSLNGKKVPTSIEKKVAPEVEKINENNENVDSDIIGDSSPKVHKRKRPETNSEKDMKSSKMTTAACALTRIATYPIKGTKQSPSKHPFHLILSRGSVVDFSYPPNPSKSAIVNAANEGCLGGGGVDGAINHAGGPNLIMDREALPAVGGVRCPTGSAVVTGPNTYGELNVPYVIHAVGPNYLYFGASSADLSKGDELLSNAYTSSLERAKEADLEAIAFSLLSSGIYRGARSVKEVLKVGVQSICKFEGYEGLREVHLCAFNEREERTLLKVAEEVGLNELGNEDDSKKCEIF